VEILARLKAKRYRPGPIENDQVHDQPGAFTDPQTGMVEEQDQQIITTPERRVEIDHVEDLANF
jgi:hypothetical protein